MKINIKGRVKSMIAQMSSHVECEGEDTIAFFNNGPGQHGSVRLSRGELKRLIAANAPYDPTARRAFFEELREFADSVAPPRIYEPRV